VRGQASREIPGNPLRLLHPRIRVERGRDRWRDAAFDEALETQRITGALVERQVTVMLLFGTNMISSFADTTRVAEGLRRSDLVVVHDLFMSDTARQFAGVVLPATSWLAEAGCKSTNTHLYLTTQSSHRPARRGRSRPSCALSLTGSRSGILAMAGRRRRAGRDP
jgi:anaerobic selenocysteine-containing dehydrogenase